MYEVTIRSGNPFYEECKANIEEGIKQQELIFNQLLDIRGYGFLIDIYEALDVEPTVDGFIIIDVTNIDNDSVTIDFNADGCLLKN